MKICKIDKSDLEEILYLQKLAYMPEAHYYNFFELPALTQTYEELEKELNKKIILKAVIDSKIVGTVRAYKIDETCYIEKLAVHPDFQKQNIGKTLMLEIEKHFPDIKKYELFTGHKNLRNIAIYKKLGYKIMDKTKVINSSLQLVFMEKLNYTF